METITIVAALLAVIGLVYTVYNSGVRIQQLNQLIKDNEAKYAKDIEKARYDSKFRSSAASWGKTVEHFVPFMTTFPIPPEDVNFLGMPIDYVGFTDTDSKTNCTVHFIEVKSGRALLTSKQRNIKKAIQQGRVQFHEIVVEPNKHQDHQ